MTRLLAELHRRDHVLAVTGWLNLGLFAAMLCAVPLDGRSVLGLSPWITIGAADGGRGLPFLNWSTSAGDLRVAHLLGLHSIQMLPLAGLAVSRWGGRLPPAGQGVAVLGIAVVYVALTAALFVQALRGHPFVGI
jgi:hypothetical protein